MLSNSNLFKSKAFINGEWVQEKDGKTFDVYNPFNHEKLASVPDLGDMETKKAIESAHKAQQKWKLLPAKERSAILLKWHALILENIDDLAKLLTLEQGKPVEEAKNEILYGASFIEWFAGEARRASGNIIPSTSPDRRFITLKQPIGVVGAITPWNFPNAMITRKCAPALAAGCCIVLKPAEDTPLSALALAYLLEQSKAPKGIFNIITSNQAAQVGLELSENPLVNKLTFTGSTQVGKLLMKQASSTVKKVSLELGGNAPFIVFKDADIKQAVLGGIQSKFRASGQTCICTNRFFLHSSIQKQYLEIFSKEVKKLKLGDGLDSNTKLGPLINEQAIVKIESLLEDAISKGAKIISGGKRIPHTLLFEPTILIDAKPNMKIFSEEIFGPIAAFYTFETFEEALQLANQTNYGLASYLYSRDIGTIFKAAETLEYGIVGVNAGIISTTETPFGGVKESGIGREGSFEGIDEFLETKSICLSGI